MLLATNGVLQTQHPSSVQQLLRQHQHAVYTAAVLLQGRHFLSWPQHIDRLRQSLSLLVNKLDDLDTSHQQHPWSQRQTADKVLPSLESCIQALRLEDSANLATFHFNALVMLHPDFSNSGYVPQSILLFLFLI